MSVRAKIFRGFNKLGKAVKRITIQSKNQPTQFSSNIHLGFDTIVLKLYINRLKNKPLIFIKALFFDFVPFLVIESPEPTFFVLEEFTDISNLTIGEKSKGVTVP